MAVKKLEHVGIMVADLDKSIQFYTEVIGLQLKGKLTHTDPSITLAFLSFPGSVETDVELIHGYKSGLPTESTVHHLAFTVDDVEAEVARIRELQIECIDEAITTLPNGARYFFFRGPDGEALEFFQQA